MYSNRDNFYCVFIYLQVKSDKKLEVVLTVAGFDPSSGAGVTADLKTIAAHGLYGVACITALTVQSTQGVRRCEAVGAELVRETLEVLVEDTPPSAVKIGMLGSQAVAACVAEFLSTNRLPNVVLDPVVRSSSGAELLDKRGIEILRNELMGLVDVVTPNVSEAALLSGVGVTDLTSMEKACRHLQKLGARNIVITGGHLTSPTDLLAEGQSDGSLKFTSYPGERIETKNTHGTGCAFSSALACNLALGRATVEAVQLAKHYVAGALRSSYSLGKGTGPVNHFYKQSPH